MTGPAGTDAAHPLTTPVLPSSTPIAPATDPTGTDAAHALTTPVVPPPLRA
jgi:hypothetical protein